MIPIFTIAKLRKTKPEDNHHLSVYIGFGSKAL